MPHDVFISYASEDKAVADAMCHHLERRGLRCWIAPRDVRPGEDYAGEIIDAIAASRATVLLFSANANNSKHVKNEIERSVSHGIPVIPFRTQDVQPARSLELFLGARHWLDAMTPPLEVHFEKLAQHLKVLAGDTGGDAAAHAGNTAAAAEGITTSLSAAPAAPWTSSPPPSSLGRVWRLAIALVPLMAICTAIVWFVVLNGHRPTPVPAPIEPAKGGTSVKGGPVVLSTIPVVAGKTETGPAKEVTSAVGIKLLLIPAGQFMMGNNRSVEEEANDLRSYYEAKLSPTLLKNAYPQHRVRITQPFYLGIYHVTRGQFRQFVEATGYKTDAEKNGKGGFGYNNNAFLQMREYSWRNVGYAQTDEHPVVNVSWNDAVAFCKWLSGKEGKSYRLPSEAQWEYACRAGTTTRYYSGDDPETLARVANVADATYKRHFTTSKTILANDGWLFTSPVGRFRPNAFGLYDMLGNAWQWCTDWYNATYYASSPLDDPTGPKSGGYHIIRGGSFLSPPAMATAAYRSGILPPACDYNLGFRVEIALPRKVPPAEDAEAVKGGKAVSSSQGAAPPDKTFTNSIGMKFALIPAGEFMMGNVHPLEEELKAFAPYDNTFPTADVLCEYPRHRVRITRPFYMAIYEVTRGQFRQFVDATGYKTDGEKSGKGGWGYDGHELRVAPEYSWRNTGFPQTDDHPVVNVSWNDAVEFCQWLSVRENKKFRLPTEAEWEYACRAGTATRYWCGDDPETLAEAGNVADAACKLKFPGWTAIRASDGYSFTAPVGNFRPNAFGLYDTHGNAYEWCWDWYGADYYATSPVEDPTGPDTGTFRIYRGGSWTGTPNSSKCSSRIWQSPTYVNSAVGFRVARSL